MTTGTNSTTNCDDCGACCMGQNLVPGSDVWIAKLSEELNEVPRKLPPRSIPLPLLEELEAVSRGACQGSGDEPCLWLNRASGRCRHHKHRPDVCRQFEVGGEACLRIRAEAGLA